MKAMEKVLDIRTCQAADVAACPVWGDKEGLRRGICPSPQVREIGGVSWAGCLCIGWDGNGDGGSRAAKGKTLNGRAEYDSTVEMEDRVRHL